MRESDSSLPSFKLPSSVNPEAWSLTVTEAVEQELEFDTSELYELEFTTVDDDFTCLEGWTTKGLEWRGVPIEALMSRAQPTSEAAYSLVHGMDGNYACGLELDRLFDGLLALELDGDPLPVKHGGPARLVLSDDKSDCYESVKWATWLEVLDQPPTEHDTAADIALDRIE